MAKAMVLCYKDVSAGGTENDMIVQAEVCFYGAGVPGGGPLISQGPNGDGKVPISMNITQLSQYANNVEDALLTEATRLGVTGLARTDCLFPTYQRGA